MVGEGVRDMALGALLRLETAAHLKCDKRLAEAEARIQTLKEALYEVKAKCCLKDGTMPVCWDIAGRALAGEVDPPEDPEAQEIWEGALGQLFAPHAPAPPWLLKNARGVGADSEYLGVRCSEETVVSYIQGAYGERLDELLAPRKLKLIHGGEGGGG